MPIYKVLLDYLYSLYYHLSRSLYSKEFYVNIFTSYKGYGLKYILNLTLISVVFTASIILYAAGQITNYLEDGKVNKYSRPLDIVLNHLPELSISNGTLTLDTENPIIIPIDNTSHQVIIDPNSQLSTSKRQAAIIYMNKNSLIIQPYAQTNNSKGETLSWEFKWKDVVGENQIITSTYVKQRLLSFFHDYNILKVMMLVGFLFLLRVAQIFVSNILLICLLFFLMGFRGHKIKFMQACRMVMFAAGVPVLIAPIVELTGSSIDNILQLWTNLLMVYSVMGLTRKSGAP